METKVLIIPYIDTIIANVYILKFVDFIFFDRLKIKMPIMKNPGAVTDKKYLFGL